MIKTSLKRYISHFGYRYQIIRFSSNLIHYSSLVPRSGHVDIQPVNHERLIGIRLLYLCEIIRIEISLER